MTLAVILAHGDLTFTAEVEDLVRRADLLIAADGGSLHAVAHGWWPQLLIGDLDSTPPEVRDQLAAHGAEVRPYSPRKDETDTELALHAALAHGADEIILLGAIGDRLDHSLANIFLLALPAAAGARVALVTGRQRLLVIRDRAEIHGHVGDLVSLLPLGGDVRGIRTMGLEYPLQGETLPFAIPRGISNVLTAPVAVVSVESGMLLAIVTREPK